MGHLPLGKTERFAKLIFYFLRADSYANCNVVVFAKLIFYFLRADNYANCNVVITEREVTGP